MAVALSDRVIVAVSVDGRIVVESSAATDVWVDVVGWFVPSMVTFDYVYDGDGVRRSKSGPAGSVGFVWSRAEGLPMLLAESTGEGVRGFVYGPGGVVVAQHNPDGSVWDYHRDQLGSTVGVTDRASGAVVRVFGYGPYGAPVAVVPAVGDPPTDPDAHVPFGYAGQYTDSETGFQYLRARYYDLTTGTFLTRDPIAAFTRSPYAYVGGSPLNWTDPSGLISVPEFIPVVGGMCIDINDPECLSPSEGHSTDLSEATVNVAGGALEANPMYWVADGVDQHFGAEIDVACYGVDRSSGYYFAGALAMTLVDIKAGTNAFGWTSKWGRFKSGGGGWTLKHQGRRMFGADWNKFMYRGTEVFRPHLHFRTQNHGIGRHWPWT